MKIIKIKIENKHAYFGKHSLITSNKNSAGKTTFIRLLLYSFGWHIPSTKGLQFKKLQTELTLENFDDIFQINRNGDSVSVFKNDQLIGIFDSKNELNTILSILTGVTQPQLLDNLLGLIYFDQEKGWTLLNRGNVIGSIKFNIERLLEGLNDSNFDDYAEKIKDIDHQIQGYRNILKILAYQDKIRDESTQIDWTYPDELNDKLRLNKLDISSLKVQIESLNEAKRENKRFKKMITGFGLRVKTESGEEVIVSEKNIIGFEETQSFIDARLSILNRKYSTLLSNKSKIELKLQEQMDLFDSESQLQTFNSLVANMNLNSSDVEKIISNLKIEETNLKKKLSTEINKSAYSHMLYQETMIFAKFLGVDQYLIDTPAVIKLNELKKYSGAVLHLLVFSFRMADLKVFQEKTSLILPIVIDSPFGKEISKDNVSLMYQLIHKYFPDNQIITASIENIEDITQIDKKYLFVDNMMDSLD